MTQLENIKYGTPAILASKAAFKRVVQASSGGNPFHISDLLNVVAKIYFSESTDEIREREFWYLAIDR